MRIFAAWSSMAAAADGLAVHEQLDVGGHTLALGNVGLTRRRELEAEDVVAFRNRSVGLHLLATRRFRPQRDSFASSAAIYRWSYSVPVVIVAR
jgi:hypothetical protein